MGLSIDTNKSNKMTKIEKLDTDSAKQKELSNSIKQAKSKKLESKLYKDKLKKKQDKMNSVGIYGTPIEPRKSLNTFLRNQNKYLINAIAIFDRKAALLIRISTATISVLIAFHEYLDEHVINGYLISIILVIGLLCSLILSILSTKPHTSYIKRLIKNQIKPEYPLLKYNIFYSPGSADLVEYEHAMTDVVKSQDLQVGNQVRANFILAKNNDLDAQLLSYSYNIFLITFLIAGVIFIISRFSMV